MGKCVTPPTAEAARCLTLRSGRCVLPVSASSSAACRPRTNSGRPRRHRGSALGRCCGGAEGANKSTCGGSSRRRSGGAGRVLGSQQLCDGREDRFERPKTPLMMVTDDDSDAAMAKPNAKQLNESRSVVVVGSQLTPSSPPPPPPTEAEMEAFFAAAELAERRRFADAYNYDVALDRPLEGRFEWAPMNT